MAAWASALPQEAGSADRFGVFHFLSPGADHVARATNRHRCLVEAHFGTSFLIGLKLKDLGFPGIIGMLVS